MVSDDEAVLNWKEELGRKYKDLPVNEGDAGDVGLIPGFPPEGGMETHSSILARKIPWTEIGYSPWGFKESDTTEHTCTILINDKMCMRLRFQRVRHN